MEYVGGTSLKQIRKAHNGPLPPDQAVAYIVEIAPALGYLHDEGLAYCDFKPDNVMQSDEQLKLIDLGATVAMDDDDSVIYGTRGYQAPEIAWTGPTVATRPLHRRPNACCSRHGLPPGERRLHRSATRARRRAGVRGTRVVVPRHPSRHRPGSRTRFASMDELADQLTGVLHEIAAADSGHPQPRISTHFSPQRAIYAAGWDVPLSIGLGDRRARVPRVDPNDPGAALLATTSGTPPPNSSRRSSTPSAESTTAAIPSRSRCDWSARHWSSVPPRTRAGGSPNSNPSFPADWRLKWYSGQCALLEGDFDAAAASFDAVLTMLPGELDPKLGLAATAELRGAYDEAARYYETVWRTNHSFYSAAFGLARLRARAGDRAGAIATLDQITAASAHFTAAGTTAIEISSTAEPPTMSTSRRCSTPAIAPRH